MATLAFGVVGAVAGFAIGGPFGANIGFALGSVVGQLLFPTPQPQAPAQQISNSTYGTPIPLGFGTILVQGALIWATQRQEDDGGSGGILGKGGLMGGASSTGPTFTQSFQHCFGQGECEQVLRIYFNTKIVYNVLLDDACNQFVGDINFRVYKGTETQMPDSIIVADRGEGNVSANRGLITIVFDNVDITDSGGALPSVSAIIAYKVQESNSVRYSDNYTTAEGATLSSYNTTLDIGVDPKRRLFYLTGTSPNGYRMFDMDTFAETRQVAFTLAGTLWRSNVGQTSGYIYESRLTTIFGGPISKIDPSSFAVVGSVMLPSVPAIVIEVALVDPNGLGLRYYLICKDFGGDQFQLVDANSMILLHTTATNGGNADSDRGIVAFPSKTGSAEAWTMRQNGGANNDVILTRWIINSTVMLNADSTLTGATTTDTYTFTSSTWDSVGDGAQGMAYDQGDGCLIFWMNRSDVNGSYVIKVDPTTGDIVWKTKTRSRAPDITFGTYANISRGTMAWYEGLHGTITLINTHDGSIVLDALDPQTVDAGFGGPVGGGRQYFDGPTQSIVIQADHPNSALAQIFLARASGLGETTGDIVSAISEIVGFDVDAEIDVTQLTDTVPGYLVSQQSTARDAITPLATLFFFDGVESDGKEVFKKRGGISTYSFEEDDLIPMDASGNPLIETRDDETTLPERLSLTYMALKDGYEPRTAAARRIREPTPAMRSRDTANLSVQVAFEADQSQQICESLLFTSWNERTKLSWKAAWNALKNDGGDVTTINLNSGRSIRVRVTKVTIGADLSVAFEGVRENDFTIISTAVGDAGIITPAPLTTGSTDFTVLFLMDIPLLRDIDDTGGASDRLYVALSGYTDSWPGATLWDSPDGAAFSVTNTRNVKAVAFGSLSGVLPDTATPYGIDTDTRIRVFLARGSLASVSMTDFLNNVNVAIVGSPVTQNWEVILFKNATQQPDGSYILDTIIRARRGTDTKSGMHVDGEFFVVPTPDTMSSELLSVAQLNTPRFYKGVTLGQIPETVNATTLNATGAALKPWAPVHNTAVISGSDILLGWTRRNRIAGELQDGTGNVPMSEETESYSIDIYNGSSIVRTLTSTTDSVTYLAANITTDFGGMPTSIKFAVYQISAVVGRGYGYIVTRPLS